MDQEQPAELDRLADRDWRWWELYCGGMTQTEIARKHRVAQSTVSDALARVREQIPATDRQEEVQRSLALLGRLRSMALEVVEMVPTPVSVGKDGNLLYDPEVKGPDGKGPALVRDYSGRLRAIETAAKLEARIGAILGYDAAQKLDMHVDAGERVAAEKLAEDAARRVSGQAELDEAGAED